MIPLLRQAMDLRAKLRTLIVDDERLANDGGGGDDPPGSRGLVGFFQLFDETSLDALNVVPYL